MAALTTGTDEMVYEPNANETRYERKGRRLSELAVSCLMVAFHDLLSIAAVQ